MSEQITKFQFFGTELSQAVADAKLDEIGSRGNEISEDILSLEHYFDSLNIRREFTYNVDEFDIISWQEFYAGGSPNARWRLCHYSGATKAHVRPLIERSLAIRIEASHCLPWLVRQMGKYYGTINKKSTN